MRTTIIHGTVTYGLPDTRLGMSPVVHSSSS